MLRILQLLFTWWNGATIGTYINTWFRGRLVGQDVFGNRYYESKDGRRRWVLYQGTAEASRVPPEWHGWMHHTVPHPPTVEPPQVKSWETEHLPNLTGTKGAYRPPGSLEGHGQRAKATGDYEAWRPD